MKTTYTEVEMAPVPYTPIDLIRDIGGILIGLQLLFRVFFANYINVSSKVRVL